MPYIFKQANDRDFISELVCDPTYPYIIDNEILPLIDSKVHTLPPEDIGSEKYMCFRKEFTAVYVFGLKSLVGSLVSNFPLHP